MWKNGFYDDGDRYGRVIERLSLVVVKNEIVSCRNWVMGKTHTKDEMRNLVKYNGIAFYDV